MKLVCIKHPKYDGNTSPVLSCKTCCGIFIGVIKERSASRQNADAYKWIEDKVRQAAKTTVQRQEVEQGAP